MYPTLTSISRLACERAIGSGDLGRQLELAAVVEQLGGSQRGLCHDPTRVRLADIGASDTGEGVVVTPHRTDGGRDGAPSAPPAESDRESIDSSGHLDESAHESAQGGASEPPSPADPMGGQAETDTAPGPGETTPCPVHNELEPGSNVLVKSDPYDRRRVECCLGLLGCHGDPTTNVVLIRFTPMAEADLERIVSQAHRVALIAVGTHQSVPDGLESELEYRDVTNPNDLTRVGIITTGLVREWARSAPDGVNTAVCLDSLDVLLQYKDLKGAFRFLHLLFRTLEQSDTSTHVHVDDSVWDAHKLGTISSLFDHVIDSDDR